MATLLLGAAGGLVGGALFGPVGALAGRALGALGGAMLDQTLLGGSRTSSREGPRLTDLDVMASTPGASIPRLYGRARLSGQVIWATKLNEVKTAQDQSVGGKGGSLSAKSTTVTYTYYANFAVALCAGPISRIGRIWADGKLLDVGGLSIRAHLGGADQEPDSWIAAKQGNAGTPAYRGVAYLVFENLDLTDFGNRLPQITAEVERGVGALESQVRAVTLIPGATEFGYDTVNTVQVYGVGSYGAESRHVSTAGSDFEGALEQLLAACPNLERVSLVVSWFGDDLRAGQCTIRPKCERHGKSTFPSTWAVGALNRLLAREVSQYDGRAAYGGTPSDITVVRAIRKMNEAGIKVTLNPFVMMDIPVDNTLENPWTGSAPQPPHPWRGRIVCDPAPDLPGSAEGTAACAEQVAALFGTAQASDFVRAGTLVVYDGPAEWSLRRMALHYAHLAVAAGGVEAILIGSEMEALTRLRDHTGAFPAAEAYAALAVDVKAVVGADTLVSYGANWAEYGAQVFDGGEVRFPLDVLWASPAVDFVGIDYYPPITDWRDGTSHLDASRATAITDPDYLKSGLRSGEAYDWYYADDAARDGQDRTPITDGDHDEPWVYRQKDLWSWWAHAHHERIGGIRSATPTLYVPAGKPIRLMEAGCGAVDKGPNRPSAFPDPKSSEDALPPYSTGTRDDMVQRRTLEAILATFDPAAGASLADNPAAPLYGGRMVEPGCVFLWTWDARPYPQFPLLTDVWGDGDNWNCGHWLTGRLGSAPLDALVETLCADFGVAVDATRVSGVVEGYVVADPMSARTALEPLARAFSFAAAEEGERIIFHQRGDGTITELGADDLVQPDDDGALVSLTRAQESELPLAVTVGFIDPLQDYRKASVSSRRLAGRSRHVTEAELALVAAPNVMVRAADVWLQDLWAARETASFSLLPSRLALMPGDVVRLTLDGRARLLEITRVEEAEARTISARSIDPEVFDTALEALPAGSVAVPTVSGPPAVVVLDLPTVTSADPLPLQYLAAAASPWPGTLAVWRSTDGESFSALAAVSAPSAFGTLLSALAPGPVWRFDRSGSVLVEMDSGQLTSASESQVLEGSNVLALFADDRTPELIQFTEAELVDAGTYRVSGFLRGRAGTEASGDATWPEGTRVLRIDATLVTVASGLSARGQTVVYRVGPASGDYGDDGVTEVTATVSGTALLPLAPVHLAALRTSAGIVISFIRRTRLDGDSWDVVEVPLNEASEAYRVEILSAGAVVRTFEVSSPSLTYTHAAEIADFGSAQARLTVRVRQISATVGAGAAALATLDL